MDIYLQHEDWRDCPVIYPRNNPLMGEIVPTPKPSLDSSTLIGLGYREVAPDLLVRTGMTKARRPAAHL